MFNRATTTIDATTTQQTSTGTVLVTTDPTKPLCHELTGNMIRNIQRGQSKFGAWYQGNVGFSDVTGVCVDAAAVQWGAMVAAGCHVASATCLCMREISGDITVLFVSDRVIATASLPLAECIMMTNQITTSCRADIG